MRRCIISCRRWCALRWLWGKNPAVAGGFGWELFLQPSAHPFPSLSFHFQFHVPQRAGRVCFQPHRVPFVDGFACAVRNRLRPYYGGAVKLRPTAGPHVNSNCEPTYIDIFMGAPVPQWEPGPGSTPPKIAKPGSAPATNPAMRGGAGTAESSSTRRPSARTGGRQCRRQSCSGPSRCPPAAGDPGGWR